MGSRTKWADGDGFRPAVLTVRVSRPNHSPEVQTVALSVDLCPYPSCKHSHVTLEKTDLLHTEDKIVRLKPRDVDNQTISQTMFQYRLILQYNSTVNLMNKTYSAGNGNDQNMIQIHNTNLRWMGVYRLSISLLKGRNHSASTSTMCTIADKFFTVKCAHGFHHDPDAMNECIQTNMDAICQGASLSINQEPVQKMQDRSASVKIGGSAPLTVTIDANNTDAYKIQSVNLLDAKEEEFQNGSATINVVEAGGFSLQLLQDGSSCSLLSRLRIKCKQGMDQKGTRCMPVSKATNLQKVLGVCIGVILTAVILYFGYIGRQTHRGFTNVHMLLRTMAFNEGKIRRNSGSNPSTLNGVNTANRPTKKLPPCNM